MDISILLGQSFLLGISLSPICLGVCMPLLAPYFGAEQRMPATTWMDFLRFMGGRLVGYAIMGLLAGWIGQELLYQARSAGVLEGAVFGLMGMLLIGYALVRSFPHWGFCEFVSNKIIRKRTAWMLGFLTGINICPPFLAALFEAARTGGPMGGALVLIAFFLGTSLILLPLPVIGILAREKAVRMAGKVAAGLVGMWFLLKGFFIFLKISG